MMWPLVKYSLLVVM